MRSCLKNKTESHKTYLIIIMRIKQKSNHKSLQCNYLDYKAPGSHTDTGTEIKERPRETCTEAVKPKAKSRAVLPLKVKPPKDRIFS